MDREQVCKQWSNRNNCTAGTYKTTHNNGINPLMPDGNKKVTLT